VLEDWAHSHISANAMSKATASCIFKLKAAEVEARVRAVVDRTNTDVGEVRHCTVEVTQPAEPGELGTLQLKMQVAVAVG
jgi:hypothetical protein